MKTVLVLSIATLLFVSTIGMGATVDYQHPKLTIVANEEPLHSVLKSVGREMQIFVTVPSGLNFLVSCDIQHQTIKQAFNTLLQDTSYSLEWNDESGRLLGLTVFPADQGAHDGAAGEHDTRMTEQLAAQEESMKQEAARQEEEMSAYLESLGIPALPD